MNSSQSLVNLRSEAHLDAILDRPFIPTRGLVIQAYSLTRLIRFQDLLYVMPRAGDRQSVHQ